VPGFSTKEPPKADVAGPPPPSFTEDVDKARRKEGDFAAFQQFRLSKAREAIVVKV